MEQMKPCRSMDLLNTEKTNIGNDLEDKTSKLKISQNMPDIVDSSLSSNLTSEQETENTIRTDGSNKDSASAQSAELACRIRNVDPNFVASESSRDSEPAAAAKRLVISDGSSSNERRAEPFFDILDQIVLPPDGGDDFPKVILLHVAQDRSFAEKIREKFRSVCNLRAGTIGEIGPALLKQPFDLLKAVTDWADVSVIIISNDWLDNKEYTTALPPIEAENAVHHLQILRKKYRNRDSYNCEIIPIVRVGTDNKYRKIVEISNAVSISNSLEDMEVRNLGMLIRRFARVVQFYTR